MLNNGLNRIKGTCSSLITCSIQSHSASGKLQHFCVELKKENEIKINFLEKKEKYVALKRVLKIFFDKNIKL